MTVSSYKAVTLDLSKRVFSTVGLPLNSPPAVPSANTNGKESDPRG